MALVKCPECQREVSDESAFCVHCGYHPTFSIFIQDLGFDGVLFRLMIAAGIIIGFPFGIYGWLLAATGLIALAIRARR